MDWRYLFLDFDGRIGRKTFWIGMAVLMVALVLATSVSIELLLASEGSNAYLINLISLVTALIAVYPSMAITVKRLHDRGRSGWLAAPVYLVWLISTVGDLAGMTGPPGDQSAFTIALAVIGLVFGMWLLIETGFLKGTLGPNEFGPDPLEAGQPDAAL